jgi:ribonuclease-3
VTEADSRVLQLERLEVALGYHFEDRSLLEHALRHSSYAHEESKSQGPKRNAVDTADTADTAGTDEATEADGTQAAVEDNERLEFLGDAILALVVADLLYRAKPQWREGELTRSLHALVEGRSLEKLARSLDVGAAIQLGRTERHSGGHEKASILENTMEAILGAIYLDSGLEAVRVFVARVFADALAADAVPVRRDPKTEFQERAMARNGEFPAYHLVCDSLIEGDENRFTVEVALQGKALARGVGRTKRAGEREAASGALVGWNVDEIGED